MPSVTITNCVRTSKQLSVAQKGLASRISETYTLTTSGYNDDSPLGQLDTAVFPSTGPENSTKPVIRTRYIDDSRFVCTGITYKQLTVNTFQMDVEYTGYMYDGLNLDGEAAPKGWQRLSRRCSFRNVQLWTYPTVLPTNYNAAWPPTAVIAGTPVDMMGTPENYRVWHHTLEIELHIDRSYEAANSNPDAFPIEWNQRLFKRNSVSFLSYPAGTVVFIGFQQAMTEDPWDTYTLSFLADQWGHLEQRVIPNVTGGVLMTNVSTWAGKPIKQADAAYWYQPWNRTVANSLYNLNLLSPSASFDEIEAPSPAWVGYP